MKKISLDSKIKLCGFLFAFPFFLFYLVPMVMTMGYSVVENSFSLQFAGLKHYADVWANEYFRLGLQNTFLISFVAVGCTLVLLLIACYFSMNLPTAAMKALFLLCIPFFTPSASMAAVWRSLFGTTLFSPDSLLRFSLVCMFIWKYLGVCILVLSFGMTQVPTDCLEAASLDGAGRLQTYVSVVLPMCRGTIALLFVLLLTYALRLYREDYLLYGEYPTDGVYLLQHYLTNHFRKLHYPAVAAGSVLFAGLCSIPLACIWLLGRRKERVAE